MTKGLARHLFKQMVSTAIDLEEQHIFHGDLKESNMLLDLTDYTLKIFDFGCARKHHGQPMIENEGTLGYMPPEWALQKSYFPCEATVWSLGIILYSLMHSDIPYPEAQSVGKTPLLFGGPY